MKDYTFIIKHILKLAIYLVIFTIFCLIFDRIDSNNKAVNISEIIFISLYLTIGGTYLIYVLIKHDREIYKRQKEKEKKFFEFLDILETFNYDASSLDEKIHYLLAALYEASSNFTMTDFYARSYNFSRYEIKELLYNVLDNEFNEFINDIILDFKEDGQIALFRRRIVEKINKILGILDEGYYYDATNNFRIMIYHSMNSYKLLKEGLKDNKFVKIKVENGYTTFDDAYLVTTRTIYFLNENLRDNINAAIKNDINLYTFKVQAHTYRLALNPECDDVEFSLFRLNYFLNFRDFKTYKSFIEKNKYKDFELLKTNFQEVYKALQNYFKSKNDDDLKKLYSVLKEEIDTHIINDKFRIEE